jgi:hypothetical protein
MQQPFPPDPPGGSFREFREQLVRFGLELRPDKTRLIEFGCAALADAKQVNKGISFVHLDECPCRPHK